MPAPLAIPPNRVPFLSTVADLGTVSVVMIARAADSSTASPLSKEVCAVVAPTKIEGMSSRTPMTPVEATTTSSV